MIGYGKSQNKVYEFLKEHKKSATSKEVGLHFGKTPIWTVLEESHDPCKPHHSIR